MLLVYILNEIFTLYSSCLSPAKKFVIKILLVRFFGMLTDKKKNVKPNNCSHIFINGLIISWLERAINCKCNQVIKLGRIHFTFMIQKFHKKNLSNRLIKYKCKSQSHKYLKFYFSTYGILLLFFRLPFSAVVMTEDARKCSEDFNKRLREFLFRKFRGIFGLFLFISIIKAVQFTEEFTHTCTHGGIFSYLHPPHIGYSTHQKTTS